MERRGDRSILTGQEGLIGRLDLTVPGSRDVPPHTAEVAGNGRTDRLVGAVTGQGCLEERELDAADHTELVAVTLWVSQRVQAGQIELLGARDERLEPARAADADRVVVVHVLGPVPVAGMGELRGLEDVALVEGRAEGTELLQDLGVDDG